MLSYRFDAPIARRFDFKNLLGLPRGDFMVLLGGAAAVWPLAAVAQPPMPAETIAAQVRLQAIIVTSRSVRRGDTALSKPNEAVWVLNRYYAAAARFPLAPARFSTTNG